MTIRIEGSRHAEWIEERFEIVRRLGEGAFGVVEEAIDRERGLRVARKSLKRLGAQERQRFKFEFRALADLTHPSLPIFYELFTAGDDWFFTMEVVDGAPLDDWVRGVTRVPTESESRSVTQSLLTRTLEPLGAAEAPPPDPHAELAADAEQRLRDVLTQLREVLSFLHARGYVHRDLKPSNVRVRDDGRVVLLDFGLATRVGDVEGRFVGTTTYAAPEQARPGPATAAMDAYALGTIVYELIAGRPPFAGSGAQMLLDKQLRPPPDLRSIVPTVAEDLARLVEGWLERDPHARAPITAAPVESEVFVGRHHELAILRAAFDAVARGDTRVVVLEGESGIGKSTLVERAIAEMRAQVPRVSVFVGRPSPKERVPFNAFDAVLARDADELATTSERTKVHAALRGRLERHAADAPLVLWIDDMQWADDDSLALLQTLLRPPQLRPALFVLSRRGPAAGGPQERARGFVFPCARHQLTLAPLSTEESKRLAAQLGAPPARARSVATRSAGHPLFVRELSQWHHDERAELSDVLRARIDALPALEQRLLRLLAVSSAPLDEAKLARGVEASAAEDAGASLRGEVARSLEHLRRIQLVRVDPRGGVGYRTYHDRVRDLVACALTNEERVRAHQAILAALDDSEPDLHARLEHLLGAGRAKEAAEIALRAAARAEAVGATRQAAELLEVALGTTNDLSLRLRRVELLERAHAATEAADESIRIAELLESKRHPGAVDATRPLGFTESVDANQADTHRMRAARHYLASGDLVRGRAVLATLLERTGLRMPTSGAELMAALLFTRMKLRRALDQPNALAHAPREAAAYPLLRSIADGLAMSDHVRGQLFHSRAVLAALASPDRELRAEALMIDALFVGSASAAARVDAERTIAKAHALFPGGDLPERARTWERVARATFAKHERPSAAVVAMLAEAERSIEALGGDAWWLGSTRLVRGHCLRLLGDLPGLRRHAGALVEDAEARRDFFVLTTAHLGGLLVWLADDAPLAARQVLSQVKWPEERATFLLQHWLSAEAEVEISLYEDRGDTLLERLGPVRTFLRTSPIKRLQSVRICCHYTLGRVLVATIAAGRARRADRLELRALLWALRREGLGYANARAALLEAGLAAAQRDPTRALRALDRAEHEGRRAEILLEPLIARCLRASLAPTGAHRADRERAAAELRDTLGVRVPSAFTRVLAPGFPTAAYAAIS